MDISGVDKVELLYQLWVRQEVAAYFKSCPERIPSFDRDAAKEAVKGYIDYFCGRCIKTDLSKDVVDVELYSRGPGKLTFADAIAAAKLKKK